MNGKTLKTMHRTAMTREGGLVTEDGVTQRTSSYVPLRAWLRGQGDKETRKAIEEWRKQKRLNRPVRRIKGPKLRVSTRRSRA